MASEGTSSLDPTDWMGEKRGKIEREKKEERERRNSRERGSIFFLDFLTRQEAKLIPTARATHGYWYCGILTTPGGRGFLLLDLFFG